MNTRDKLEKILKIQNVAEKTDMLDDIGYWLLEDSYCNRPPKTEDIGEAAAFLLKVAFVEENQEVKYEMLELLRIFSSYGINKYIDWDIVTTQIPLLSEKMVSPVLEIVGYSQEKKYILLLEEYLDHPQLEIQMTALDALGQIWWDIGKHNNELKQTMKIAEIQHIWFLLLNSHNHNVPYTKIQEQFLQVRKVFIENMRNWFKTNGDPLPEKWKA